MRKILVKNSLSGLLQSVINMALVFTVIPVFIRTLGIEYYGVFSLIIVIGNLNLFTNLGLTSSLIKFLAEQGKIQESNYDIVVTFFITLIVLLPITLAAAYFNKFILLNMLRIPPLFFKGARILYLFLLSANFLIILGQVFKAVLDSGQKITTSNFIQISYNFIYWILILIILLLGYGLPQIGMAAFLSAFVWFIIITYKSLQYWGKLSLKGLQKNYIRVAKKQFFYGSKIYIGGVLGFLNDSLPRILISHFIGIQEVGFFDIAYRIKNQLWGGIEKIFYPLYPLLSSIKDNKKVRLIVHDIEQKIFIFIIPITIIIIFTAKSFIQLWIGKDVEIITISVIYIVSAFMIGSITVLPNYQFLIAKGHAGKTVIIQVSNIFISTIIFLVTFKWIGYYAAILGTVSLVLSSFVLSLYYQKKYLNSLIFDSKTQIIKLIILTTINVTIGYFLNLIITSNWLNIIITPIILLLSTILQYRYLKFFKVVDFEKYLGTRFTKKRIIKFFLIEN